MGFLVPLKKIESEDIVEALRHRILPGGMGKPQVYLIDGGAEFKKHLRQAVMAWAGHSRVHAPHHHQSAGIIEVFNKTIKKKLSLLTHGNKSGWVDIYMDAIDIYNALPHSAASDGTSVALSPAELYLGRKLEFAWEHEENQVLGEKLKPSAYGLKLIQQRKQANELLEKCRADYSETIEAKDKHSKNKLRVLKLGTEVTKYTPTRSKRTDGVTPTQEGPFEVVEVGDTGADYLIQRTGTTHKPIPVHIDEIKELKRASHDVQASDATIQGAKRHAKAWEVVKVVGERGSTRRTKQWKLVWDDGTTSWEPTSNCNDCSKHIKDWTELGGKQQRILMDMEDAELKAYLDGEAVASVIKQEQQEEIKEAHVNLVQDISKLPRGNMIQAICDRLGIDINRVLCVCASPPCESFSHADASNISRGHYYRDHNDTTKPPRSLESCTRSGHYEKRLKAIKDDLMVKSLVDSMIEDRRQGMNYHMIIENPLGSLRKRPYMMQEGVVNMMERATVDYCTYGKPYRKSTDLWNTFGFEPAGNTGNGECQKGRCGMTTTSKHGKPKHRIGIACDKERSLKGKHITQQLWSLPNDLTSELMEQMKNTVWDSDTEVRKDIVLDLFSGGESWRRAVEDQGYKYFPVDIAVKKASAEA
jgi:hypothetical protein